MAVSCRVLKNRVCEITQSYGGNNSHLGIDLVGANYTIDDVIAHSSGVVILIQTGRVNNPGSTGNESYGNFVKIDHGNGWQTLYAHLQTVDVVLGEDVIQGQLIGTMGNTGNSYGAHLHFEVWKDNVRVDPYQYLDRNLFENIAEPVLRDEQKNQLKVNVIDLRIRKSPSVSSEILGLAILDGIYNYYETFKSEGYIWYKIGDDNWLAGGDGWITIYPKLEDNNIEEMKLEIESLKEQINLLERENENLKQLNGEFRTFVAEKSGLYYIRLEQNEALIYKRVA